VIAISVNVLQSVPTLVTSSTLNRINGKRLDATIFSTNNLSLTVSIINSKEMRKYP